MKIRVPGRMSSIMLAVVLAIAAPAASAAQRAFVASTGLDINDCSLAHPCRTFGAAIASASAGGEVVVLDSAGYGGVTIGKAISIIAPAGIYAGISVSAGDGITIAAGAADTVKLRGLRLTGLGGANGIVATSVGLLDIANVEVNGFSTHGLRFAAPDARLTVADSVFLNNGGDGALVQSAAAKSFATFIRSRFDRNNNGVVISTNVYGSISESSASYNVTNNMQVIAGALADISDCTIAGLDSASATWAIEVQDNGSNAHIARCKVSGTVYGISATGVGAKLTAVDTTVIGAATYGIVAANGAMATAERCSVTGGSYAYAAGGGGVLSVSNSTATASTGAAFYAGPVSTVYTRQNNTLSDNAAKFYGAGALTNFVGQ
jgi:hypothetical protein